MTGLLLMAVFLILIFSFVILFGAPFLPTLKVKTEEALDLLDLKAGQTLLELGSGDGRILRAAAERGIYAIGYELNPLLVIWSILIHWRKREFITVRCANYWHKKLPAADGIYVFLLDRYMQKLDTKITQEISRNVKLVSFAFEIADKKPVKQKNGLFLYTYRPSSK